MWSNRCATDALHTNPGVDSRKLIGNRKDRLEVGDVNFERAHPGAGPWCSDCKAQLS